MRACQFEEIQVPKSLKVLCPCKMVADCQSNVAMKKTNPVLGYITESRSKREKQVFVSYKTLATSYVLCIQF